MRRVLAVLTLITLIFSVTIAAQDDSVGVTGFGLKIGANFASLNTDIGEFNGIGNSARYYIGAYLTYNFTPSLAIQPELAYSGKGAVDNDFLLGESGVDLGYVELPILLKYTFPGGSAMRPSVFMGPALSTLISAKILHRLDEDFDIKDGMKSVDFCLVLGGSAEVINLGEARMVIDLRYTLGLTNTVDPDKWNEARTLVDEGYVGPFQWTEYDRPLLDDDSSMKTRAFSILVGFRF